MMNYTLPPGNTQPNQSKVVQPNPMDNVSFNNFLHMLYEKVMCENLQFEILFLQEPFGMTYFSKDCVLFLFF